MKAKRIIENYLSKLIIWEPKRSLQRRFRSIAGNFLYFLLYPECASASYHRRLKSLRNISLLLLLTFSCFFFIQPDSVVIKIRKHVGYKIDNLFFNDSVDHEILRSAIYKESGVLVPFDIPYSDFKLMYDKCIEKSIPVDIFFRLVYAESRFDSTATSAAGARGYCQIMPATWRMMASRLKISGNNCRNNIIISVELLSLLKNEFKGLSERKKWELVLSSYNAGLGRVIESGYKIPPIKETKDYVNKIMHNFR